MDRQIFAQGIIKTELGRYLGFYDKLRIRLGKLPEGAIIKRGEGNYSIKGRQKGRQFMIALKPGDGKLLEELKERRHIKEELKQVKKKIELYKYVVENDFILDPCTIEQNLKEQYHGLRDLDIFLPGDVNPEKWMAENYRTNPYYPYKLKHPTESGLMTRSKSEAMIGTQLERRDVHFRYEAELVLGNKVYYPDFTVLNTRLRRIIYWEHLGKLDDPKYVKKALKKLIEYAKYGIILGYNLVITFETKDDPLTILTIDETIRMIERMQ